MPDTTSRRVFLRSAAGLVLSGLAGCSAEPGTPGSDDERRPVLARPLIRAYGDRGVRIADPLDVRPAGYVSMETREVFVDRAHRDRVSWLLDAHISVSTWVWRIPLPGDSPLTPIPPGDEPREFEELPIGAWDPATSPAPGDVRIVVGRPTTERVRLACLPVQGADLRLSAETLDIEVCRPGPGEPVREDFGRLSAGRLHVDPECGDEGEAVDVYGWARRA